MRNAAGARSFGFPFSSPGNGARFLFKNNSKIRMMRNSEMTRSQKRLAHLTSVVREAGVKLTHQRLEICRELATTEEHPDAETLFRAVQERVPTMSLDTVYRTLWMLRDLGLLTTLGPNRDAVRFDVNLDRHHHYVCVACGSVRDFESEELNALRLPNAVKKFGTIVDAQVEVRGLCAHCKREKETTAAPLGGGRRRRRT